MSTTISTSDILPIKDPLFPECLVQPHLANLELVAVCKYLLGPVCQLPLQLSNVHLVRLKLVQREPLGQARGGGSWLSLGLVFGRPGLEGPRRVAVAAPDELVPRCPQVPFSLGEVGQVLGLNTRKSAR